MTITHHLDEATLMSFAAGSLPNTLSAVAAAHVSMCSHCRGELTVLERIGAALVDDIAPQSLQRGQPGLPTAASASEPPAPRTHSDIPTPLARVIGDGLDQVRWRWIGPGLWHRPLRVRGAAGSLQLIKASPGAGVPEHTHGGSELTLVLRGALIDATGRYAAGDVSDLDEDVGHTPVADQDRGCICIIATEQRTRFTGLLARLLQPWHGL